MLPRLRMNMLVDFSLVTKMDMLVGTVSARMFVRVPGQACCVLVFVSMAVRMLMAVDMLMFVRMNHIPVGVLVAMTVHMLVAMLMAVFVRPFHVCLLLCAAPYRFFP